jgi:hypothetical protein
MMRTRTLSTVAALMLVGLGMITVEAPMAAGVCVGTIGPAKCR